MNVTHRLTITANCPVDDQADVYRVTVETDRVLPVETILEGVAALTRQPLFQEELTERLAELLGAVVTTKGTHTGVRTVVVHDPRP